MIAGHLRHGSVMAPQAEDEAAADIFPKNLNPRKFGEGVCHSRALGYGGHARNRHLHHQKRRDSGALVAGYCEEGRSDFQVIWPLQNGIAPSQTDRSRSLRHCCDRRSRLSTNGVDRNHLIGRPFSLGG